MVLYPIQATEDLNSTELVFANGTVVPGPDLKEWDSYVFKDNISLKKFH